MSEFLFIPETRKKLSKITAKFLLQHFVIGSKSKINTSIILQEMAKVPGHLCLLKNWRQWELQPCINAKKDRRIDHRVCLYSVLQDPLETFSFTHRVQHLNSSGSTRSVTYIHPVTQRFHIGSTQIVYGKCLDQWDCFTSKQAC